MAKPRGIGLPRSIGPEAFERLPPEVANPLREELLGIDQNFRELLHLVEQQLTGQGDKLPGVQLPRAIHKEKFDHLPLEYAVPIKRELDALDQNIRELLNRIQTRFGGVTYKYTRSGSLSFSDTLTRSITFPDDVHQEMTDTVDVAASSVISKTVRIVRRGALAFSDALLQGVYPPVTQLMADTLNVSASSVVRRDVRIVRSGTLSFSDVLLQATVPPVSRLLSSLLSVSASSEVRRTILIASSGSLTFSDALLQAAVDQTPAAPSNLEAEDGLTAGTVVLTWNDNSDNEDNFDLQRRLSPSGPWSTIATVPANTTSYTDQSSVCDTAYDYRVRAVNSRAPSAFSPTVTFTPCELA